MKIITMFFLLVFISACSLDTKSGKVVTRRKKKASTYKLPYKDSRGKVVTEE